MFYSKKTTERIDSKGRFKGEQVVKTWNEGDKDVKIERTEYGTPLYIDLPSKTLDVTWGDVKYGNWRGKDLLLTGKEPNNWDWQVNGTKHNPGIVLEDVTQNLRRDTKIILLTRGMDNALKISPELNRWTHDNSRKYDIYIGNTKDIAEFYNSLSDKEKEQTLLLLHSTC